MLRQEAQLSALTFEQLQPGQSVSLEFTVAPEDVDEFARLSGDCSPLHMDEQFARRQRYRGRIAHGMLVCAPVSALVGMCLPGLNATILNFRAQFLAPVRAREELLVEGRVKTLSPATHSIVVAFQISNRHSSQVVVRGEVGVVVNPPPKKGVSMVDLRNQKLAIDFHGKTVIVTGASRGIGEATIKLFAHHGARVVANYLRGEGDAARIVDEIVSSGAEAFSFGADVRNRAETDRMVKETVRRFGSVDILVNNAVGGYEPREFRGLTWDELQEDLDVIVKGAFNCIQSVLPGMIQQGQGRIINLCTVATSAPVPKYSAYVTAKTALLGLTRALAVELGGKGILVNAVSPGLTDTDLVAHIPDHVKQSISQSVPVHRIGQPMDTAKAVVFLASPYADFINGHQLVVSGGELLI